MAAPQILVCHNMAAAMAAADLLGMDTADATAIDWTAMAGERLILWPAATKLSILAMGANARAALQAGAASVKLIEPGELATPGWDAVMATAEGWDKAHTVEWLRDKAVIVSLADIGPGEPVLPLDGPPEHQDGDHGVAYALPPPGGADIDWRDPSVHEPKWEWLGIMDEKRRPICNVSSVLKVLDRHPQLGDVFWFDEFLQRILRRDQKTKQPREWADADEVDLLALLQRDLGLSRLKLADVRAAVVSVAFRTRKNCAQDWLNTLKWDEKPRIDEFFPDTFGCLSGVYSRAVSKNFWLSMVARVMDPGCKVDNMVILEGSQGAGKSSSMELIGGDWFAVQHEQISGKGFFEILQGKMLIEISEMDAFSKAEVTKVKGVVTTRKDRYREAYGRHARDHMRTSIFVGTTNKDDWNRDETGARRFWPIRCMQPADLALLKANREQLFAEAVHRWRKGESWWEVPLIEAMAEQEDRRQEDSWHDLVVDWIADGARTQVTLHQVMDGALNMRRVEMNRTQEMRVASILRQIGWTKKNSGGRRFWASPNATT